MITWFSCLLVFTIDLCPHLSHDECISTWKICLPASHWFCVLSFPIFCSIFFALVVWPLFVYLASISHIWQHSAPSSLYVLRITIVCTEYKRNHSPSHVVSSTWFSSKESTRWLYQSSQQLCVAQLHSFSYEVDSAILPQWWKDRSHTVSLLSQSIEMEGRQKACFSFHRSSPQVALLEQNLRLVLSWRSRRDCLHFEPKKEIFSSSSFSHVSCDFCDQKLARVSGCDDIARFRVSATGQWWLDSRCLIDAQNCLLALKLPVGIERLLPRAVYEALHPGSNPNELWVTSLPLQVTWKFSGFYFSFR